MLYRSAGACSGVDGLAFGYVRYGNPAGMEFQIEVTLEAACWARTEFALKEKPGNGDETKTLLKLTIPRE
jgi:hypothetical protein